MIFDMYKKLIVADRKQLIDMEKFSKTLIENNMADVTYVVELAVSFGLDIRSCVEVIKKVTLEEFSLLVELKICSENDIIDSKLVDDALEIYDNNVYNTAFRILKGQGIEPKKQYPEKTVLKSYNSNRYEFSNLPFISAMYYSPVNSSHLTERLHKFVPTKVLVKYLTDKALDSTSISRKNYCLCFYLDKINSSALDKFKRLQLDTYPASLGRDKKLNKLLSTFVDNVENNKDNIDSSIEMIREYLSGNSNNISEIPSSDTKEMKKSKVFN